MLPIVVSPVEDELLYSYIHRLAELNCLDVASLNDMFGFTGFSLKRDSSDYLLDFLAEAAPGTELNFFYSHTVFPGLFPFMSGFDQTRVIAQCFYRSPLPRGVDPFFLYDRLLGFQVCPQCYEEENENGFLFGMHTLYRSHQMPGVRVCHKHGCILKVLPPKRKGTCGQSEVVCDYNVSMLPQVVPSISDFDTEISYARFCHDLLSLNLNADVAGLASAVSAALEPLGATLRNADKVLKDMAEDYAGKTGVLLSDVPDNIRNLGATSRGSAPLSDLLRFAHMVFDTASGVRDAVSSCSKQEKEENGIAFADICPGCGRILVNTPYSRQFNLPCSCAVRGMTADAYAEHIAESAAGGRYGVKVFKQNGKYCLEYSDPVSHLTRSEPFGKMLRVCGNPFKRLPSRNYDATLEKIYFGKYSFLRMGEKDGITAYFIRCNICGSEFSVHSLSCLYHLSCPSCRDEKARKIIDYMFNGNFSLVSVAKFSIVLLCNRCNSEFKTSYGFLAQNRILNCPCCKEKVYTCISYSEVKARLETSTCGQNPSEET